MDTLENEEQQTHVQKRFLYAKLAQRIYNKDDELGMKFQKRLHDFVTNTNTQNPDDCFALIYGGRAWNHVFGRATEYDDDVYRASTLAGNYDVMVGTTDQQKFLAIWTSLTNAVDEFVTQLQKKVFVEPSVMTTQPMETVAELPLSCYYLDVQKFNDPTKGGKPDRGTLFTSSRINVFLRKRRTVRGECAVNDGIFEDINDQKHLLYIEVAIVSPEQVNVSQIVPQLTKDGYLNAYGLFVFQVFLTQSRTAEKGINVDEARRKLFVQYAIVPEATEKHQSHAQEYLRVIAVFQTIFNAVTYSREYNELYLFGFKTFETQVVDSVGKNFTFGEFENEFNEKVVLGSSWSEGRDSSCSQLESDGVTHDKPSLRELTNTLFVALDRGLWSGGELGRLMKSGGEAIRYWIPNRIKYTSDFDSKVLLTREGQKQIKNVQRGILESLMFIYVYLTAFNYFRTDMNITILFGGKRFLMNINSLNQENIFSVRALLDFAVPLFSLDMRLKYYIISEGGTQPTASSYLYFTPIDIAIMPEKYTSEQLNYMVYDEGREMLPPIGSLDYLIEDIKHTLNDEKSRKKRIRQGKFEKDKIRLMALEQIKSAHMEDTPFTFPQELDKMPAGYAQLPLPNQVLGGAFPQGTGDLIVYSLFVIMFYNTYDEIPENMRQQIEAHPEIMSAIKWGYIYSAHFRLRLAKYKRYKLPYSNWLLSKFTRDLIMPNAKEYDEEIKDVSVAGGATGV